MFGFGKPPFEVADGYEVEVNNLAASCAWYKEKLGFRDVSGVQQDDSGRPFCGLKLSDDGAALSLIEKTQSPHNKQAHVIF